MAILARVGVEASSRGRGIELKMGKRVLDLKGMPAGTKIVQKQRVAPSGQRWMEETEVDGASRVADRLAPSASSREDPARGRGNRRAMRSSRDVPAGLFADWTLF